MLKGKNVIDPNDLTDHDIKEILDLSKEIIKSPQSYCERASKYILATLFYEPSTRTRLSFESAMLRLGGKVIGFSDSNTSSVVKGESMADTIRTVECYSDIVVIRHPKEGAPKVASLNSSIPIINAGDGCHYHPTQTLTDLLTIKELKGRLDNLTIGLCGDLKFGRTVHSLIQIMCRYKNTKFIFISPEKLKIPDYIKKTILEDKNIDYIETENLEEYIPLLDILYMTRVQKERFFNEDDYLKLKDNFILDSILLKEAKKDLIVMHPLPRNNEISVDIDNDSRAAYFKQAKYGLYVRMALILKLLGIK